MDIKTGLWEKTSQSGNIFYSGSIKLNDEEFWVNLYMNDRKTEDKHPDMNLIIKPKNKV